MCALVSCNEVATVHLFLKRIMAERVYNKIGNRKYQRFSRGARELAGAKVASLTRVLVWYCQLKNWSLDLRINIFVIYRATYSRLKS